MAENKILHGGCYKCGSKQEEILISVILKGELMGVALCSKCLTKENDNVR